MKLSGAREGSGIWRLVPVAAAAVLVALLAPGCGQPAAGTPEQIVKKAIAAQAGLRSVAMELDSEVELKLPGTQRSAIVSYDGFYEKPDRWHLNVRSSGAKSEVIIMGDRTFVKLPGADSWTEREGEMLQSGSSTGQLLGSKYLESASEVEMVDRKGDTYHLQFYLDMQKFARSFDMGVDPSLFKGKKALMEVWVLKDSMNVEKATMTYKGDLGPAGPGELSMSMELDFSDFNEPVSIEPPTL
jgi:outer membrane lipoprotein-sorting protein